MNNNNVIVIFLSGSLPDTRTHPETLFGGRAQTLSCWVQKRTLKSQSRAAPLSSFFRHPSDEHIISFGGHASWRRIALVGWHLDFSESDRIAHYCGNVAVRTPPLPLDRCEKSLPLYWPITTGSAECCAAGGMGRPVGGFSESDHLGYYCDPELVSLQFSSYRQPWKFADGI